MRLLTMITAVVLLAVSAQALTPADKCEAAKLKIAGKYGFCRLKAESKAVKIGGAPDYSLCDLKYSGHWSTAETTSAGQCPTHSNVTPVQAFIARHTDELAAALAGGPLPDCPGDLATCTDDLSTCTGNLGTCTGNLGTCNTSLTTCNGNLTACNNDLTTAQNDLATCNGGLSTCTSNLASCSADLATVNAGTAAQGDVLSGETFSSSSGLNLTGTMPNNGAVSITPGTTTQTITAGYHNGSGSVAGDAELVAGNIKNGVNVFGVMGTLLNPPLKTGQTTAYGTGSDGDLQKGAVRSYTDNGDGTVTDNTTGLMWEKKSDDGSIHDKDNTYTWGMTSSPYTMNGTMVTTFLAILNGGGGFAGWTDWRIPNLNELESIRNLENVNPAVSTAFNTGCVASCTVTTCSCTQSAGGAAFYWSSNTARDALGSAIYVNFYVGYALFNGKNVGGSVRAVRGGL